MVVVHVAEALGAAVCVTAMGRGAFPETHPLYAGVAGFMTDRADGSGAVANAQLRGADLVLVVGSALDGVTTDGGRLPDPRARVIRVDRVHRSSPGARPGEIAVLADASDFFEAAQAGLPATPAAELAVRCEEIALAWTAVEEAQRERASARADVITPSRLMGELQRQLGPDDLLVCDAAYSSVWALSYLRQGRHFSDTVAGRGAGTLGFGLPAAIGAARAFPGRRVAALVGDGGFGFGWGELETVARLDLDITCIVLNNSEFAYQRLWHELNGSTARGLGFARVDHSRIAEAVGIRGIRVNEPAELAAALDRALGTGPALLDVVVDADELPPFRKERHIGK